jgi:hypothetical protein
MIGGVLLLTIAVCLLLMVAIFLLSVKENAMIYVLTPPIGIADAPGCFLALAGYFEGAAAMPDIGTTLGAAGRLIAIGGTFLTPPPTPAPVPAVKALSKAGKASFLRAAAVPKAAIDWAAIIALAEQVIQEVLALFFPPTPAPVTP